MLKMNIYIYILYIMKMRTNILRKRNNVRKAKAIMRFIEFNNIKQEKEITLKVT